MYFNSVMIVAEVLPGIKLQSFANKQNSAIIIITDTSLIVLMNVVLSLLIV